jgi:hypothetical protein
MFFSRPELLKCKRSSIESRPILRHPSSLVHWGPIALVSVQCVFVLSVLVFTYCIHQAFDYLVKYNCLLHSLCFIYLFIDVQTSISSSFLPHLLYLKHQTRYTTMFQRRRM